MEAIGAISGLITVVEVSVRITRLCLAYSREVKNASADIQRLEQTIIHLKSTTESVLDLLQGPDNWRLRASQKLLLAAEDSKVRLDNLEERLQPSSTRGKFMRLGLSSLKWPFQKKDMDRLVNELSQCSQAISAALQVDQINVSLQTSEDVANIDRGIRDLDRRALLDQLPVVHGAAYDSHAEEQNSVCLAETRVDYLHQILEWSNDPGAESLFWLKGMVGTGKSTISRTIARSLAARGILGATFFFRRGEADRNSVNKLFTTIAFQLSIMNARVAQHVIATIKSDPALPNKAIRDQFDKLIVAPLFSAYQSHEKSTLVIILDALDECEDHADARNIINLFSQSRSLLGVKLRIFITSRPELMLRLGFNEVQNNYRSLDLSNTPSITVEQDISRYFTSELARIRREYNVRVAEDRRLAEDWPGQNHARDLIEMAIPLFIFAATVCRFLAEVRWEPDEQLVKILNYRSLSQLSKLDATYTPVLDQLIDGLSGPEIDEVLEDFHTIVGTIILLGSPLTTSALSQLLDVTKRKVDRSLDMLHSVLSIPDSTKSPVRLLHTSFRDYLLNPKLKGSSQFWIDKRVVHTALVECCMRVMGKLLHDDICDLRVPGAYRTSIQRNDIDKHIPEELQYAVLHWTYHASEASLNPELCKAIHQFLKLHFLHWVECFALLGRLSDIFERIRSVEAKIPAAISGTEGPKEFLLDGIQFIRRFFEAIHTAPLQLYSSALLFSPHNSIVRQSNKLPGWVTKAPIMQNEWDPCVLILEGHKRNVHLAIMSPDMNLIAACTSGKVIWIWDAETGEVKKILEGHIDKVTSIAFSQDSSQLASSSKDKTIRLWDVSAGICLHEHEFPFSFETPSPSPTLLLQDSVILARAQHKDGTFHIWEVGSDISSEKLNTSSEEVVLVGTKDKRTTMISVHDENSLRVWRANDPSWSYPLKSEKGLPTMGVLSIDSKMLALSFNNRVEVWQTDPVKYIADFEGHKTDIWKMSFSPDTKLLVTGSVDCIICVWELDTGECIHMISSHLFELTSLEFSPDSSLVISAAGDGTIRVWHVSQQAREQVTTKLLSRVLHGGVAPDLNIVITHTDTRGFDPPQGLQVWSTETGRLLRDIVVEGDRITSTAISRDSAIVAVSYISGIIRLWSLYTGECLHELCRDQKRDIVSIALNYDATTVACSCKDHEIQIWSVSTGECLRQRDTPGCMFCLAFAADGALRMQRGPESQAYAWSEDSLSFKPIAEPFLASDDLIIDKSRRWIQWKGQNLLYIPLQYYWNVPHMRQQRKDDDTLFVFGSDVNVPVTTTVNSRKLASLYGL